MHTNIHFRKAGVTDVDVLRDLMVTTFRDTYEAYNEPENFRKHLEETFAEETILEELRDRSSEYWLGCREGDPVCYFKLNYEVDSTRFSRRRVTEIQRIYVHPDAKGHGIGGSMLDKVKEESRRFGADFIWLGVWERNPAAIRFYEKHGFQVFGTHIFRLGNDDQQDYLMKYEL